MSSPRFPTSSGNIVRSLSCNANTDTPPPLSRTISEGSTPPMTIKSPVSRFASPLAKSTTGLHFGGEEKTTMEYLNLNDPRPEDDDEHSDITLPSGTVANDFYSSFLKQIEINAEETGNKQKKQSFARTSQIKEVGTGKMLLGKLGTSFIASSVAHFKKKDEVIPTKTVMPIAHFKKEDEVIPTKTVMPIVENNSTIETHEGDKQSSPELSLNKIDRAGDDLQFQIDLDDHQFFQFK